MTSLETENPFCFNEYHSDNMFLDIEHLGAILYYFGKKLKMNFDGD